MKRAAFILAILSFAAYSTNAQNPTPGKPRILISTDIGGTDPDDNQSMAHLLMYNEMFDIEGLVSSPSFGKGSKEEILRMIDLYEKDYPALKEQAKTLKTPDELRALCKQGRRGNAPIWGYGEPTEGSDWIVKCARKQSDEPLWILVWGGIEDVAQALHDAPDIQQDIRVYWIGGPNKKWSVNAYAYIAGHFPNLWMIENNASYRGFICDNKKADKYNKMYYDQCILGAGCLGKDFKNYYDGFVKMGDTPSLLYLMDGNPEDPAKESWGGSFEKMKESPRSIFARNTTIQDTVPVYSVMEFHWNGPKIKEEAGTKCFVFHIAGQDWDGYYLGNGAYGVNYSPKAPGTLAYSITSDIKELDGMSGMFVVGKLWPGKHIATSYGLGDNWYADKSDPALFEGIWQGFKTTEKWRNAVLTDWEKRWSWLKGRD